MADDETKQLLRDILAAQKAQLEYLQRQDRTYVEQSRKYEESASLYRDLLWLRPWEAVFRGLTAIGIVGILIYLVFR